MQVAKLAPKHVVNWEDAQGQMQCYLPAGSGLKLKRHPSREEGCPAEEVPRKSGRYRGGLHAFPPVQQLGPE